MSLKSFLTRLIWLCVLPLVMLAAYFAIDHVRTLQTGRDLEASNLARNFATALDRHIDARISALQVLAASSAMGDSHRLSEFYLEAQAFQKYFDSHVVLADLSNHMLLSTRVPYGTSLPNMPQVKGHSSVSAATATGKPAVGDIYLGPIAKVPMVSIAVPVIRDGRTIFLLLSVIESRKLQQRLEELTIPHGWSITLLDGKDEVIARRSPQGIEGRRAGVEAPGRFVVKSAISPWSVVLEVPLAIYRAPIIASSTALVVAILAATLVGVLGGLLASRRLARSVAALAETPLLPTLRTEIAEIETVRRILVSTAAAREVAEYTLRESEERLRLLGDNLPDSYVYQYLHEADGTPRFLYLSAGVERLHGLRREDVLRDAGTLHRQIDPEQMPALEAMEAASLQIMADFVMELHMCRTDGEWRWLQVRSRPRRKADGQVLWDGVATDITGRKQAEQDLLKKNADIEQFLYTVSHDLRSPLVTVKTFMGFLASDMAGNDQERVSQDMQFIHNAADKMKMLLDELLEMSRIDRVETPPVRVSLMEVVTEVLDVLAGVITDRKVDVRLPDSDLMLFGDRPRLSQIWQNLIENAIKYSRNGSISRIELGVQQVNGETVFFVKDNGIGIDPQYHTKIFGMFEKLNPKSPGAGLGLTMIQRIVEKCSGRVWVESEGSDKGACFFFTLPNVVVQV